ncbi:hypothetical protein B296_00008879 [Ensete ventricosum]|uniref:Uncharacterized protein n=1 Tax=Ensete ventricosum TaxID=4639 RepID=A0A427A217_ENSVE|nr:hypothetical protein B296_00008879 [Ensete ventricosum]
MMRLNRVQLFSCSCYTFVTKAVRKEDGRLWPGPLQGRSTTTRVAIKGGHRGSRPQLGRRGSTRSWPAHKGKHPLPAQRGAVCEHRAPPPVRCRSRAATLIARVVANGAQQQVTMTEGKGQQGLGFWFSSKRLFCPSEFEKFLVCPFIQNFLNTLNNSKNFKDYPFI